MPSARVRLVTLVQAYLELGIRPEDDEEERFRKRGGTAIVTFVSLLALPNTVLFLLLDRPLTAAVGVAFLAVSVALLGYLFATKDGVIFLRATLLIGFLNPILVMWSLGGFAQGGAAILWSFSIPLAAMVFWGARSAVPWAAACVVALFVSAALETTLSSRFEPLPVGAQTALFVFVLGTAAVVNLAVLIYFVRLRDLAQARSDSLLRNILPAAIADRLKVRQADVADRYDAASVLFVDIVNFTAFADRTPAEQVVALLGRAFATLDDLADRHGIEKIKTLGDGYLAVAGVPTPRPDHAAAAAGMALDVSPTLREAMAAEWPGLEVRVGIASGALVAGVIGRRRFSYDVWGDTVNTASRMASVAEPGRVVVTAGTAAALADAFRVEPMADVPVKGKGVLRPYRLVSRSTST
jgi:guanylate cyclase